MTPAVHCFHNRDIDITVLGTVGAAHARNPRFSWAHLDLILQRCNPELLLVQIRPEHLKEQELFDGEPDMAYLAYAAHKMKVDCRGIDWWLDVQLANWQLVGLAERLVHIHKNIRDVLDSTRAQMILIAVDVSFVEPLCKYLVLDDLKEWSCPQAQFIVKNIPDLSPEILELFRDGTVYLASRPYVGAAPVEKKMKELRDIIKAKGYFFKR
jgi:hypothetical protein